MSNLTLGLTIYKGLHYGCGGNSVFTAIPAYSYYYIFYTLTMQVVSLISSLICVRATLTLVCRRP